MMYITPVFSIYTSEQDSNRWNMLLEKLRTLPSENKLRFAVRTSISALRTVSADTMMQLQPFIQAQKLNILIDSIDASFAGLFSEKDFQKELHSTAEEFEKIMRGQPLCCMPRWHDYHRDSSAQAYSSSYNRYLLPTIDQEIHCYAYIDWSLKEFVPAVEIENDELTLRRTTGKILSKFRKYKQKLLASIESESLHRQENWDCLLVFEEADDLQFSQQWVILEQLEDRKQDFSAGLPSPRGLVLNEERIDSTGPDGASAPVTLQIRPTLFDPPVMTPAFIGQLFPSSYQKRLRKNQLSTSVYESITSPDQRVESPRPHRELTSSMLGRVILQEQDMKASFDQGNVITLEDNRGDIRFNGGISSQLVTENQGKTRKNSFSVESAFALESEQSRGLRQTLKLAIAESQIAGRITNDFLQLEDSPELILDSYIQHPWIRDEAGIVNYIPQMIGIWDDLMPDEQIDLRSLNSDGSSRRINFRPVDLHFPKDREVLLLLPGMRWILSRGPGGVGFSLIHGKQQHIDLPSAILLGKKKRDRYTLAFLPTGRYINCSNEMVNGLMEHYSLRIRPNTRKFEEFQNLSRKSSAHIAEPFVIYY